MRLVSLCPSMTDTLFQLGVGDQIVGATRFCVHPKGLVEVVEKVGGTKDPNIARIKELKPDMVFFNKEENRKEDWQAVLDANIACHQSHPVDVASTLEMLRDLGKVLEREEQAESLISSIEKGRETIHVQEDTACETSWAYLIWRKPWMTVSKTTYIHGLISEVTPNNVFGNLNQPYNTISAEQLAEASPEKILLSSEPFPFKTKHIQELSDLTGLPASRFMIVDGERLSWHGAMTAAGLAYALEIFSS